MSNSELEIRAEWIRKNGFWNDVRDNYLAKKNSNDDPKKRSRSIYAETINETYKRYNKK